MISIANQELLPAVKGHGIGEQRDIGFQMEGWINFK